MLLASRLFFFLSHAARYFETCAQSKLRTPTNLDITALDGIFCIGGVHTGIEKVTLPWRVVNAHNAQPYQRLGREGNPSSPMRSPIQDCSCLRQMDIDKLHYRSISVLLHSLCPSRTHCVHFSLLVHTLSSKRRSKTSGKKIQTELERERESGTHCIVWKKRAYDDETRDGNEGGSSAGCPSDARARCGVCADGWSRCNCGGNGAKCTG